MRLPERVEAGNLSDSGIIPGLELDRYRRHIDLDEPFHIEFGGPMPVFERAALVARLLDRLIQHERMDDREVLPYDYENRRRLLRGLLNVRPPLPMDSTFVHDINRLLRDEASRREILHCSDLPGVSNTLPVRKLKDPDRFVLWKGDITRLKVDAIVNAANDQLLGCFRPLHNCIDNVIHSAAGPLLRRDCHTIMEIQGRREQTGDAKITRAYNLPSKFVLHTVGPVIGDESVTDFQRRQLASCYRSCLALANRMPDIKTIAFPCISTGVFKFPREMASEIAVLTVVEWLSRNRHHFERVVFDVYLQEDLDVYSRTFQCRFN